MIYKKIIVIFLLILSIFSIFNFSSVHAENINVTSSSSERMKEDIDYLKQLLKNNNINNINDLATYLGANSAEVIQYFFIMAAGEAYYNFQYVYFYNLDDGVKNIPIGFDDYSYYGVKQNSFKLPYNYGLRTHPYGDNYLSKFENPKPSEITFTAPICWLCVRTVDMFSIDSSQIVANAVGNVNNSVNTLNGKLTEDNSNQDDINLGAHNDEMNAASDTIKNSGLFFRFNNYLVDQINDAFTYNDDEVSTIPISIYGKSYVLRSDEISSFFKNNNLYFVIVLWQSILWFSLLYTMFLFVRKLYKSFAGGNPVDEVSSTLSSEDNKIVGGF